MVGECINQPVFETIYHAQNSYPKNEKTTQCVALNNFSVAKIRTEYRHQMNQNHLPGAHCVVVPVVGYIAVLAPG